jgi:hypothetical protein
MKTKLHSLFIMSALLLLALPAAVQAQYIFTTNTDGSLNIYQYTGSGVEVIIPSTNNGLPITTIGENAFFQCYSLSSVTVPNSVTSIGEQAFMSCMYMTNISMPSVTNIGAAAFLGCFLLTSAPIGTNVTTIGVNAFGMCFSLTSVTIPANVTSIGDDAFSDCTSLTNITVATNNPAYCSEAGVLFDKNQTLLLVCPAGKVGTSVTIPKSVTIIEGDAFWACTNLTGVYFQGNAPPETDGSAFYEDKNVTAYYLPGTTGWENFSAKTGIPAVLWNPQAQTSDGSFGVQSNQFGFNITGNSNLVIVVEACTNLSNPIWCPVATNTLTAGSSYFSDPQWTNYPGRFYRVCSP